MILQGLIAGVIVGFVISMPPLGPTYFAVVERALKNETENAVAIGAGAGFLDMIYVLIGFGGISALLSILPQAVNDFLLAQEELLKIVIGVAGAIILIFYGYKMTRGTGSNEDELNYAGESKEMADKVVMIESKVKQKEKDIGDKLKLGFLSDLQSGVVGNFFLGIGLCLSSVTLFASWLTIVGYLKGYGIIDSKFMSGLMLGIGVLAGTTLWFYVMAKFLSRHSGKIKPNFVNRLSFFTGIFLIILGVVAFAGIATVLI